MELCRLVLLTWLWIPACGEETISMSCVVQETCVLPCRFEHQEKDLHNIEWYKHTDGSLVHALKDGADLLGRQAEAFRKRTSMFPEQVPGGNASVQLSAVRTEDEGLYLCRVHKISYERSDVWVNLRVEAPVKAVTLEQRGDVLVCRSEGVYPRPNVSWTPPSEHQTQERPMKDGLYSVSSSRPLDPLDPQAPRCFTCNVSTDTSWKSATYCLQSPVERSANVTIPCVDYTAPENSLKWTFNYIQTIVTRSGDEVSVTAPWRPYVEAVSESGSLMLKDPGPEQWGEFVCELQTDDTTFTSRTELREADRPALSSAGIGLVTFVLIFVTGIIIFLVVRHKKKQRTDEQLPLLEGCEETNTLHRMLQMTLKHLSQNEMEKFKRLLADQSFMNDFPNIPRNELDKEKDVSKIMIKVYGVYSVSVTRSVLEKLKKQNLLEKLSKYDHEEIIKQCIEDIRSRLSEKFKCLSERFNGSIEKMEFNNRAAELFITEGGPVQVSEEKSTQYSIMHCQDIFKRHTHNEEPIRTVLTKGGSGVGKTVLIQKLSLDWAEGRAHQDVQLLLPFTFRELHVLRDRRFSLVGLVQHFFSQTKGLCSFQLLQLLFIFDGLDECRLPLDFSRTRVLTEPTESASVEELLVNLIRGNLLPSARLWITTRPAAANQIPAECVSMVTEVRGFSDPQKEQYFRKRFRDEEQATDVISHIKTLSSLYGMCYNPLFCWILSTVLLHLIQAREKLPHTLTPIYNHFLQKIKLDSPDVTDTTWSPETTKMVKSLGKLAFEQLQKGNLIFSEGDLSEYGLDAAEIARYSGVFREEPGLIEDKVYSFIHQTVQEFLAALHVHQTFFSSGENLLSPGHSSESSFFYHSGVDRALQSPNGHLDLLLRFLLGLSLPTNQRLLTGLLTETGRGQTNQRLLTKTVEYIKEKLNEKGLSAERSLNLLHCLNELNDCDLVEQIQKFMKKARCYWILTPAQWSALSVLLLSSDSDLEEFDLRKFYRTEEALLGLLPVVKVSTKANLSWCGLSSLSCAPLASVLSSSILNHLDLSNNDLQDSGVELLCEGLKSADSRLETLRLSGCLISERGGASLAEALSSNLSSNLKELDLTYNHPGPSAELLTALRDNHPHLDSLRLDPSGEQFMVPGLRKYSCEFSLEPNTAHRNLLLSEDNRTATYVWEEQPYPDDMDRFSHWYQVLSSTAVTGRCYFEVDCSRRRWNEVVSIAVSYKRVKRTGKGRECVFGGDNDLSWSLTISDNHYIARHNDTETFLSYPFSLRVGVFLDSEAGVLSFYQVLSDGLSHLHTFNTSFTEPLFPGFEVGYDCKVTLVNMKS